MNILTVTLHIRTVLATFQGISPSIQEESKINIHPFSSGMDYFDDYTKSKDVSQDDKFQYTIQWYINYRSTTANEGSPLNSGYELIILRRGSHSDIFSSLRSDRTLHYSQ